MLELSFVDFGVGKPIDALAMLDSIFEVTLVVVSSFEELLSLPIGNTINGWANISSSIF